MLATEGSTSVEGPRVEAITVIQLEKERYNVKRNRRGDVKADWDFQDD